MPDKDGRHALRRDFMTVGELAEYLGKHPSMRSHSAAIFRLLRQGKLRTFRVGSKWEISRDSVNLVYLTSGE